MTTTMTSSPRSHKRPIKPQSSVLSTRNILLVSMAAFVLLCLFSVHLLFLSGPTPTDARRSSQQHPASAPPPPPPPKPSPEQLSKAIKLACKATRFPDICASSLSQSSPVGTEPGQVLDAAISVSAGNLKTAQDMVKRILDSSVGSVNRTTAAKNCLQILGNSAYRTQSTFDALPRGKTKDARAWLSAALLYQYDCWSGLKYANDTALVNETMSFLNSLTMLTSNALGMLVSYDLYGNNSAQWRPPATERDGFWEPDTGSGAGRAFNFGIPSDLKADVTVCKDGSSGCYEKVQDAVDAAPDNSANKFVIYIKSGVYEETVRIPFEKKNIVFMGDGMGKSIITGNLNVGMPGMSTYNTATVGVLSDGFMATGITIENTAGPDAHQAVAFRSDSDLSFIENCEFLGNQDTLYVHSLRQFYKSCRIEGNVDFIFGNSASLFQDCEILIRPRQLNPEKGENNAITAHGRTDPSLSTGFVFQNCLINGTEEYMKFYNQKPAVHRNYLGRPWKEYSRTVFINCDLEALVTPEGWMPWSGDFALNTLYYGEYNNSGPGSNRSKRVNWSSAIPAEHVDSYSVTRFLQGDEWIPTSS